MEGIGVRKRHDGEGRLAPDPGDLHGRVAEVELGLAGGVRQGNEDLLGVAAVPSDGLLHLGDAPGVAVLVPEALEDALGGVMLLGRRLAV